MLSEKHDLLLAPCFDAVVPVDEIEKMFTCYFLQDGVLANLLAHIGQTSLFDQYVLSNLVF